MQLWRFLAPSSLGFVAKNAWHGAIDKISGAPPRPQLAAQFVLKHAEQNNPQDVLNTLDKFAREERWLMSVGPEKGPLVQEMASRLPSGARVLELGAYCGYSAIMLSLAFGEDANITSVELSKTNVESAGAIAKHAGLSEQIEFIHGSSTDVIAELDGCFDLVFLDHWKDLYTNDLQLIEQRELIRSGSIVVADNVGDIFSPETFLNYVRNCGHYQCESRVASIEYTSVADAVEICVYSPTEKGTVI
ncbi:MAG: class I SAM-dependent methyltransferase [Pseudomonadota bacterium]